MDDLPYSRLVECYEVMVKTSKRTELTDALVSLYGRTPAELLGKMTYLNQGKLYPDYMGVEVGVGEKLAERAISTATGLGIQTIRELYRKLGDMGSAAEEAAKSRRQESLFREELTVSAVYDTLDRMAKSSGKGSVEARLDLLAGLMGSASPTEAKYIVRTALGKLRLGVADYTVLDALAITFAGGKEARADLERAYNLCSDLGEVAKAVARAGLKSIRSFKISVGRPVRPMLAERLSSAREIVEKLGGECSAEYKYDGERMQVHKDGGVVTIFSRRLEKITGNYPDAVKLVGSSVGARRAILECEAVAVDPGSGDLLPFQQLMHRRRKHGVQEAAARIPISLFFFDILMHEGKDMTVRPYSERRLRLESAVAEGEGIRLAPALRTASPDAIEGFMQRAIEVGCEGLVVKDLKSRYRAGARAFSWIKLKREYRSELTDSTDLVIVGAFHGRGRRAGVYGAYLLAAYDKPDDTFRSVTKVGTGFSDEDLAGLSRRLDGYRMAHPSPRLVSKMQADVWFQPAVVIEVVASELTLSPIHTAALDRIRPGAGLALRFPKFTGKVREDKSPEDATTVEELVGMYGAQLKKIG
ncbi:MAG: ATP-dependent DNA ligase [Nitrososphaerota archaeon]|nr:ATP-dependent DNA ligase [Nitrososphaerota archaeon]